MTREEALQQVIGRGDEAATVRFFDGMPEAERRKLAPLAATLLKQSWTAIEGDPERFTLRADQGLQETADCANLAVWATATLGEMKKLGWRASPRHDENCFIVMAARRPPWLPEWSTWLMEEWPFCWPQVRRLVKDGYCPEPDTEAYVLGMITHLGPYATDTRLADSLEAEPDLLEDLFWRIFEVEGGGDQSLAAFDKYSNQAFTWQRAVLDLAARGSIDRGRVLDASLDALNRDFSQFRAGWFSRLHEALKPSLEERQARTARYLELLASPIPPTVSLTIKALKLLQAKNRLPAEVLLDKVEPVLYAKSKATVVTALKMLATAVKADPDKTAQAAGLAAVALEHPASEAQEAALALLERLGNPADPELRESVVARRELASPALRGRIDTWLGTGDEPSDTGAPTEAASSIAAKQLQREAEALDEDIALRLGLPALLGQLDSAEGALPAIDLSGAPRLAGRPRLDQVTTVGELIDLCLEAIERPQDLDLIERALEGLARLAQDRPDDFGRRAAPLISRLAKLEKRPMDASAAFEISAKSALTIVLKAWLTGVLIPLHSPRKGSIFLAFEAEEQDLRGGKIVTATKLYGLDFAALNRSGLLLLRAWALAEMIRDGLPAPLLSTASHQGGWLAPAVLAERANFWHRLDRSPALPDVLLALLRLAPEGRTEALEATKSLPGEWGAALRYALGGTEAIGQIAPLWIAACRARAPFADDPAVIKAFPKLPAGGGHAATYHHEVEAKKYDEFTLYTLKIVATPKQKQRTIAPLQILKRKGRVISALSWDDLLGSDSLLPTVIANQLPGEFPDHLACSVWPGNCDALFAAAALDSHGHEEENRPAIAPIPAPLELLLDPEVPLTSMALMLLCQALNARDATEGQLAGDVLIAVIEDGRLLGPELGATLRTLLKSGIIKPKRWSPRLKAAAQTSPLPVQVLRRALETALTGNCAQPPRDLAAFLELLLELYIESTEAPPAPWRASSRAAGRGARGAWRISRRWQGCEIGPQTLCRLKPGEPAAARRAAQLFEAVRHRLARGKRWQAG